MRRTQREGKCSCCYLGLLFTCSDLECSAVIAHRENTGVCTIPAECFYYKFLNSYKSMYQDVHVIPALRCYTVCVYAYVCLCICIYYTENHGIECGKLGEL